MLDVADQWMAFVASHGVNAVLMADHPQSLQLKQMLETLKVSPLKVGGVLLYRIPVETLAPYADLTAVDMEARENEQRLCMLLIAAHRYLADGGNPAGLTLGAAVQRGPCEVPGPEGAARMLQCSIGPAVKNGRLQG